MQTLVIAPRSVRPQPFLQEQTICSGNGRTPREFSIISIFAQELRGAMRGAATAGWRSSRRSMLAHALDVAWDRSLSRQEKSRSSRRRKSAAGERRLHEEGGVQRSVANRSDRAGQERGGCWSTERRRSLLGAATGKTCCISSKRRRRACSPGSASCSGSFGTSRSIFISPESDQGHERRQPRPTCINRIMNRLHETAPDFRRQFFWNSCSRTPMWCFSPTLTIRAFSGFNPYALGFCR